MASSDEAPAAQVKMESNDGQVIGWILRWMHQHSNEKNSANDSGVRVATFSIYTIQPHLRSIYTLFLFLNTAVFAAGLSLNAYLIFRLVKKRLYRDHLIIYLLNIAVADIVQLTLVLPYTLCVSLFEYWFLGRALCYVGPWLLHIPNTSATLLHLLMALHRYRQIMCPLKEPLPIQLCLVAAWVVAMCVNLPVSIFHRYIDIEVFWRSYLAQREIPFSLPSHFFRGITICVQAVKQSLRDFARATFIILFAMPFIVVVFLYVRSTTELSASLSRRLEYAESLEEMEAIAPLATETREDCNTRRKSSSRAKAQQRGRYGSNAENSGHDAHRGSHVEEEPEEACPPVYTSVETSARLTRERNVQNCLIFMTVAYVVAWSPVKILSLCNPLVLMYNQSPNEPDRHVGTEQTLDITYLVFLLFTHLATCLNPVVIMKRLPYGTDTTVDRRLARPSDVEMRATFNSVSNSTDDAHRPASHRKRQSNATVTSHRSSLGGDNKRVSSRGNSAVNAEDPNNDHDKGLGGLGVL